MKRFYYINLILMGFYCNGYAFNDTTIKGNCNVVVTGKVEGSITCQNIPEKALETLNKLLSSPDKINEMFDSARTIQNLNDLVSLKEDKLRKTELTLQEKVTIANDWAKKYQELDQRLKDEVDELSKQALMALQNGDLIKAGELLDKSIDKREQQVDKLAKDHFTRAKVFELQFEPVKALPHFKKAYTYRPDNSEYSFAYAFALQKQNDFKTAAPIYETYLEKVRELSDQDKIAITLNNLGNIYKDMNKPEQAERNFEMALDIYTQLIDSKKTYFPHIAAILNNLGVLYSKNHSLKKAEESYQKALNIYKYLIHNYDESYDYDKVRNVTGALDIVVNLSLKYSQIHSHEIIKNSQTYLPELAMALSNLGAFYLKINNLETAEIYLKKSLDVRRKLYETNPSTHNDILANTLVLTALSKKDSPEFCILLKEAFQVAHLKDLKEYILKIGKTCNLTPSDPKNN
jgi:tetratricopeptide (TPR) repeat protein